MGISRMTAMALKHNESVYVVPATDKENPENKKLAGTIWCLDMKDRPRLLLSSDFVYDDEASATKAMNDVIAWCKNLNEDELRGRKKDE